MTFVGKDKAQEIVRKRYRSHAPAKLIDGRPAGKPRKPKTLMGKIVKYLFPHIEKKIYNKRHRHKTPRLTETETERKARHRLILDVYLKLGSLKETGKFFSITRERVRQVVIHFPEYHEHLEKQPRRYLYEYTCSWCQNDHAFITTKGSVKPRFCSKECMVKARTHVSPTSRYAPIEVRRKVWRERMRAYYPKLKDRPEHKETVRKSNLRAKLYGTQKRSILRRREVLTNLAREALSELPSPLGVTPPSTEVSHISSG